MNEQQKYKIIKKLIETDGNKQAVALKLDCSLRHINRLIKGYREKGKTFFPHGDRGKQPFCKFSKETKQLILDLYRTKYSDCNLTHFAELLLKRNRL